MRYRALFSYPLRIGFGAIYRFGSAYAFRGGGRRDPVSVGFGGAALKRLGYLDWLTQL
jgi:hypothetical protein